MIIMDNNKEIISGLAFHKISEWSLCGRYQTKYSLEDIKENDKIFINLDSIYSFADELKKNPPKNKFILITHNSDSSFREEHCNIINPFVNKIYAINNITNLPNVFSIPIGLRDWPNHTSSVIQTIDIEKNKENLLYMNFVVRTNFQKRLECLNCFIGKEWVLYKQNVSIHEYYRDISKSKYVLSSHFTQEVSPSFNGGIGFMTTESIPFFLNVTESLYGVLTIGQSNNDFMWVESSPG